MCAVVLRKRWRSLTRRTLKSAGVRVFRKTNDSADHLEARERPGRRLCFCVCVCVSLRGFRVIEINNTASALGER